MKRKPRIYYSANQRALMWDRWRKGETLHQIAAAPSSDTAHPGGVGRDSPSRAAPFQIGIDAKRARRDLAWRSSAKFDPLDRGLARPSRVFDQP